MNRRIRDVVAERIVRPGIPEIGDPWQVKETFQTERGQMVRKGRSAGIKDIRGAGKK
jgi:hypothetical protein